MQEFDKSEAATPFKLQQARNRGSVARSPDLTGAVAMLTAAAAMYAWGWEAVQALAALARAALIHGLGMQVSAASVVSLIGRVGGDALHIVAPFALTVGAAALIANLAQTGPVWSGFPLKPDFNRINPASGLKRLFSLRTVYDAVKSVLKVTVLAWVLYLVIKDLRSLFYLLGERTPFVALRQLLEMLTSMALKLAFAALLLALLDLGYTRFEFKRKMRMSKRDVKDEVKNREGDPRVRSRLRGLRIEMLQKAASVRQVGQADVLIVNPTHIAVALQYKRGEMAAPVMLAKGAGTLAARMRAEAARCGVTVVRSPALARALFFQGDMGQAIPTALYADVARIMVWLIAQRNARNALGGGMNRLSQWLASNRDIVMVLVVMGVLIVLFMPIPPAALDFLILANFSFAFLILLLTFYMTRPVEFSTFPSLLLIATLFRLSLNVAATRLILSEANAGSVISAIGGYVVGGNYVIGLIVFLILIVVQFVVVTSGAQRVSEVAARFTLDSMPGQQMSIDADLNMGFITQEQAQVRRKTLEKEAAFYGAMDGASKFVKGDAIAGILIMAINIIGGLVIGVMQLGIPWSEAIRIYTLLTIGDGIVTQVPALVIAVATGIIVTRSASDGNFSQEVARQITLFPKTLFLVCAALFALMALPGIPALPAFLLAVTVLALGWAAHRAARAKRAADSPAQDALPAAAAAGDPYDALKVEAVEIQAGAHLLPSVMDHSGFADRIAAFRNQYVQEMGMVIPTVKVRASTRLGPDDYEIVVYGVPAGKGQAMADRWLAIHPAGVTKTVRGIETRDPTYGLPAVWIEESEKANAQQGRYTLIDGLTVLMTHLTEVLRRESANLLTRAETDRLLERVRLAQPGLVEELTPGILSMTEVQKVLQALVREKVSIRNLEAILEVLADAGRNQRDPGFLAEQVRQRLGQAICRSLSGDTSTLHVITLDPLTEAHIGNSLRHTAENGGRLAIEPRVADQLIGSLVQQAEAMMKANLLPVLLCSPDLRRHLRMLTERVLPHLRVLSMAEIPGSIDLKAFSAVSVAALQEAANRA